MDDLTPAQLDERGAALLRRHGRTGDVADLLTAVALYRAAVEREPVQAQYLTHLCVALRRLYEATDQTDQDLLNEAIAVGKAATEATREDHPWYARRLANYGDALHRRYERSRDLDALRTGLRLQQRAAELSSGLIRAIILMNVCVGLRYLGGETASPGMLREAARVGRESFSLLDADAAEKAGAASNTGLALRTLFQLTGDTEALREAVAISREAVELLTRDHRYWPGRQHNLGLALRHTYEQTGDVATLEQAVAAHRVALEATPPGHPSGAVYAGGLSGALRRLFQHHDDSQDLQEAITAGRRAVDDSPADHRKLAVHLVNLGGALLTRYERDQDREDLEASIAMARRALSAAPHDHPDHSDALALLCSALQRGAEFSGEAGPAGADALAAEAVEHARAAVERTPVGYADRGMHLANLGAALLAHHERTGDPALLTSAADTFDLAMTQTPDEHSRRPHRMLNMAHALARAFYSTGDAELGDRAHTAFRDAASSAVAPPTVRIHAYRADARLAASGGQWGRAAEAYAAAIEFLPQTAAPHRARGDREHGIADVADLAAEAAGAALSAGDPERAAVLLEAGRALIINEDLAVRGGLAELRARSPEHADRLVRLRALLNASETDEIGWPGAPARRQDLAARWEELLIEIRAIPGMRSFLTPLSFAELRAEAQAGPVIQVNITAHRADALILTSEGLRTVGLPKVSLSVARERAEAFRAAVDLTPPDQDVVAATLAWLWDDIAEPALNAAGITGPSNPGGRLPRIWWCPTGPLAHLPVHAAGRGSDGVLDRAISSCTPTVRALGHARRSTGRADREGGQALAVVMRHAPGAASLPGAPAEARALRQAFPGVVMTLTGREATREAVLAALRKARWAHFACHGISDGRDPSAGGLLLSDHQRRPLTVVDIARLGLDEAELAFLSACSTGRPGVRLTDEAIHVASAFQLVGYRHVIATLWPINDRPAVRIARHIYASLSGGADPAYAVHDAVRRARDRWPGHPSVWAAHVHWGA